MAGVNFGTWPVTAHENTAQSDTAKVNGVVMARGGKPGMIYPDADGGEWMYILCTAAVQEGNLLSVANMANGKAIDMLVAADTTAGRLPVGICGGTIAADDYGWMQIFGHNTYTLMQADTEDGTYAALAGKFLFNDTATAGQVTSDTSAVVGQLIYGAFISLASSTADTSTGALKKISVDLVYPHIISDTQIRG